MKSTVSVLKNWSGFIANESLFGSALNSNRSIINYDTIVKGSLFGALLFISGSFQRCMGVANSFFMANTFNVVFKHWQVLIWAFKTLVLHVSFEDYYG